MKIQEVGNWKSLWTKWLMWVSSDSPSHLRVPPTPSMAWRAYSAIDSVRGHSGLMSVSLMPGWRRGCLLWQHTRRTCVGSCSLGQGLRDCCGSCEGHQWEKAHWTKVVWSGAGTRRLDAQSRCVFSIEAMQWETSKGWSGWEHPRILEAAPHRLALCTCELRECPCPTGTLNCLTQGY